MNNLDIIHSDWLIHMLKKSSTKPQTRLLSLFDILEDWLDAPNAQQSDTSTSPAQSNPSLSTNHHLQDFLAIEAAKAGAALPEMLANQLYFMAVAAAQEKLQTNNQLSLSHAKNAASALITAQTEKEFRISKVSAYAIAASFLGALIVAGSLFTFNQTNSVSNQKIAQTEPSSAAIHTSLIASPQQTAALLAQLDQMRKGNCQLIEAVQLPDSSKKVYFENVVLGQISTNIEDQKLVQHLLEMVRCNYTPMLMANSKG
ncbi:MAG: hypothetical protein V4552_07310 [Pseudomonadota bacterium]